MNSEGSRDTEDWSNDPENILKYKTLSAVESFSTGHTSM